MGGAFIVEELKYALLVRSQFLHADEQDRGLRRRSREGGEGRRGLRKDGGTRGRVHGQREGEGVKEVGQGSSQTISAGLFRRVPEKRGGDANFL